MLTIRQSATLSNERGRAKQHGPKQGLNHDRPRVLQDGPGKRDAILRAARHRTARLGLQRHQTCGSHQLCSMVRAFLPFSWHRSSET